MEGRLLKATDSAVERVIGTVFERARYDAAVLDDKIKGLERTMNQHISNERIHLSPEDRRR